MAQKHYTEVFKRKLIDFIGEEDPLLSMLQWTAHQLMQIEAEAQVGAEKGKHCNERRTHFSGTRVRRMDTRLGTMYLFIPKVRKGGYIPFFVTERKRSEQALIALVQEAFINGVSTRKIERLARTMGIENISASQVSEINKGLNEQVEYFRTRSLEAVYPFFWIDAIYEKARYDGRVVNMALMIAHAVDLGGRRDILAIEPMLEESEETWRDFFKRLKQRGVERIHLCISDAHKGIQAGVGSEWIGASWQRCKVHFMRNILAKVPHRDKKLFAAQLKQTWLQPDKKSALRLAGQLTADYEKRFPEALKCFEEGLEDSLQFYAFPEIDKRKISSTNVLERINKEIRRRSRVIGVFPNKESLVRLITCYLMEYQEDWMTERGYICPEKIQRTFESQIGTTSAQVAS